MKITTKGRYGARAMLDIAIHAEKGPCLMKDIATRQEISPKYLDHILSSLRRAGLIKNIRGKHGGYILAKPAADINLKVIIEVVEGSLAPVECLDNPGVCNRSSRCATAEVWGKMRNAIEGVLSSISLEELIKMQKRKSLTGVNDYTI